MSYPKEENVTKLFLPLVNSDWLTKIILPIDAICMIKYGQTGKIIVNRKDYNYAITSLYLL